MGTSVEQRVLWGVAVPASALAVLVILVVTARFVPETYPPNAQLFLPWCADGLRPKPLDQLRYVLAIAIVPVVLWGAAVYVRRRAADATAIRWGGPWLGRWAAAVQWLLCAFVACAVVYQEYVVRPYIDLWPFLAMVLGLGLLALAWRYAPARWATALDRPPVPAPTAARRAARAVWAAVPWLLAAAASAAELAPGLMAKNRALASAALCCHDYPFCLEEFAAPANGRTVFVDFYPQYQNLLGYALCPVFRLTGLNVYTFTTAMMLLSLALLLCFFVAFRLLTGGGWRALLLFLPLLWVSMTPMVRCQVGAYEACFNDFTYLAVAPLRYIGPCLTLAALAWYFARPSRVRMMLAFVTAGAAAINNLDFGVPALGAALVAVLFGSDDGPLPRPRQAVAVVAAWAAGAALAVGAFTLGTYFRSGCLPDGSMVTAYQRAFALNGFATLPMPLFGMHWVCYLTFMAVIAVGLFDRTAPRARRGLALYAGVFGAGAMMYYINRSHPNVLIAIFPAWGFAFMILAWSCWSGLAPRLRTAGWRALSPVAVLLALGCAAVAGRFSERPNVIAQYRRLTRRCWDAAACQFYMGHYAELVECIRSQAAPGEKVAVIAPYGHLAAREAGVVNVFPFSCSLSVLLQAQLHAACRAMQTNEVRQIFVENASGDVLQELVRQGFRRQYARSPFYWRRGDDGQGVAAWWDGFPFEINLDLERGCFSQEALVIDNPFATPRRMTVRMRCNAVEPGPVLLTVVSPEGPQVLNVEAAGTEVVCEFTAPPGIIRIPFSCDGDPAAGASAPCYRVSKFAVSEQDE